MKNSPHPASLLCGVLWFGAAVHLLGRPGDAGTSPCPGALCVCPATQGGIGSGRSSGRSSIFDDLRTARYLHNAADNGLTSSRHRNVAASAWPFDSLFDGLAGFVVGRAGNFVIIANNEPPLPSFSSATSIPRRFYTDHSHTPATLNPLSFHRPSVVGCAMWSLTFVAQPA